MLSLSVIPASVMCCVSMVCSVSVQDYEQRIKGIEAKNAELAGLLENAKAVSDHHARIMELQVQLIWLMQNPSFLKNVIDHMV